MHDCPIPNDVARALKARVRQAETAEDIAAVLADLPAETEDN
jgi:hypothetical protein